jgi:hypothetical protein
MKYCGLSLLDTSNMFTLVCVSQLISHLWSSHPHIVHERTWTSHSKIDHPHHPRQSCPFCLYHPLPYLFFHYSSPFLHEGWKKDFQENKKVVKFSCVSHRDRGGDGSTHYPGKWIVSLCVRTEHPVQPDTTLTVFVNFQTDFFFKQIYWENDKFQCKKK